VITKLLVSGAVVVGTAIALAIPTGADPSVFSTLSCGCDPRAFVANPPVQDQINLGIQDGLAG
jgi:hypothetical protein